MNEEQQQPEVEEKPFSEAEMEICRDRYAAFLEAKRVWDEWVKFLVRQHAIDPAQGWSIGDRGWQRTIPPNGGTNGSSNGGIVSGGSAKRTRKGVPPQP